MANPRSQSPAAAPPQALQDGAPVDRTVYEYDVPDEDGLHQEQTQDFGSIRTIALRRLSPLNEKHAAKGAVGESLAFVFELARRSLAWVKNERGEVSVVREHDGTSDQLWHQMGPKLRSLVMRAYADIAVPSDGAQASFLKSRRISVG